MDVNLDPGLRPQVTAPTTSVAEVAVQAAQQGSFGHDAPTADSRPARQAGLGEAVARLQDHVQTLHRELHFRVDEATGQTVVRVVDTDTGELVRQMPSQDVLDLLQTEQTMQAGSGLLIREQA